MNHTNYIADLNWGLFFFAVLAAAFFIVVRFSRKKDRNHDLQKLQQEFAKGRIGKEEYEKRRWVLQNEMDLQLKAFFLESLYGDAERSRAK